MLDKARMIWRRYSMKAILSFLLLTELVVPLTGHAEITRIVIDKRSPLQNSDGHIVNQYEEIRGRLFGEVDPRARRTL